MSGPRPSITPETFAVSQFNALVERLNRLGERGLPPSGVFGNFDRAPSHMIGLPDYQALDLPQRQEYEPAKYVKQLDDRYTLVVLTHATTRPNSPGQQAWSICVRLRDGVKYVARAHVAYLCRGA